MYEGNAVNEGATNESKGDKFMRLFQSLCKLKKPK